MKKIAVGIDIGGTEIKIAFVKSPGEIIEIIKIKHDVPSDASEVMNKICDTVKDMSLFKKYYKKDRLCGVGIAVPGDIDSKKGMVRFAGNLGWRNVRIKKIFTEKFKGLPVLVENDANTAGWGSYCIDFKRKVKNLICITLGTGVGGGIIIDGKIYRGFTGTAGEIGHVPVFPDGKRCNCGNKGCIERYIGAYDLIDEVKRYINSGGNTIIKKITDGNLSVITPNTIFIAAEKNDNYAKEIWKRTGVYLGILCTTLINILNPEVLVFAGGISGSSKYILKYVKKTVKERAFGSSKKNIKIVVSKIAKDIGVLGAGCLVLYNSNEKN